MDEGSYGQMYETVSGKFYVFLPPSKNIKREE